MLEAKLAITQITLSESLVVALLGIVVVLAVLALLAILILLLSKVIQMSNASKAAKAPAPAAMPAPAAAPVPAAMPAPMAAAAPAVMPAPSAPVMAATVSVQAVLPQTESRGECDFYHVDDKTAAMLMAIVADQLGAPLNTLRFKSIKELDESVGGK
ncbi:OadG family transporter subunit [Acidaminobacterium chupaoyuni]